MNATLIRRTLSVLALAALILAASPTQQAAAQDVVPAPDPRPSPLALAHVTLDDGTYVKVHYSSPRKRGRQIFGGLVPFKEVWRFGANEATELTATQPIRFGDADIPAGTYAVFAIPDEDEWTIILNENLGQWGAFSYDEEADLTRIEVPAGEADGTHEAFTISLNKNEDGPGATMVVIWDTTRITVPIAARD